MELLGIFIDNILPIFALAGVGFLLARHVGMDIQTLSRIVLYALTPCLIFDLLVSSKIGAGEFGRLSLFAFCTILGIGAMAWLVARALRLDRTMESAFMVVVMFANGGNFGLPLTLFAFGQEVLARSTIYFVISVVLTYTVGIFLASSGRSSGRRALLSVLKLPTFWGAAAAAILIAMGVMPPQAVMRPVRLLGNAAIPVMLLVLGMQLDRAVKPEKPGVVALAVGLRLVASALLGFLLAGIIGLEGPALQAGMIQTAMPVAVVTTILAVEFQIEPAFVTSVVFLSTILSPLTLTPLIAFLR